MGTSQIWLREMVDGTIEAISDQGSSRHVPLLSPIWRAGSKDGMVYFLMQGCARTFLPEPSDGAKASTGQAYNGLVRGFFEHTQTRTYRYK